MSKPTFHRFRGGEALDAVVSATEEGAVDVLVVAAHSPELLSECARDYLRNVRARGAQVEFHQKGGVEAVLHTANRLLADIPVERLSVTNDVDGVRLLVIDNAETLPLLELQAAQRIARALKGSALRVVLFWKMTDEGFLPDEMQQFLRGVAVWALDLAAAPVRNAEPEASSRPVTEPASIALDIPAPVVQSPVLDSSTEKADVLAELAAERARERGFDATDRSWFQRYRPIVTAVILLVVLIGGAWAIQSQLTADDRLRVYECGIYPDEATLNIVRERLGRGVPTRVLREQEKWRLQVGPFEGLEAADRHLKQIWAVGPCRVDPVIIQNAKQRG